MNAPGRSTKDSGIFTNGKVEASAIDLQTENVRTPGRMLATVVAMRRASELRRMSMVQRRQNG